MPLNWTTYSLAPRAPCLPCCVTSLGGCFITLPTLLYDGTTTPYADLAEATAAINDRTADCLIEYNPQNGPGQSQGAVTASVASGVLSVSNTATSPVSSPLSPNGLCRVYLTAASDLAVSYNIFTSGASVELGVTVSLWEDDGSTLVDDQTNSSPAGTTLSGTFNFTVPADGYYYVILNSSGVFIADPFSMTAQFTANGGGNADFCTVRAAYGGTPSYLICT